MVRRPKRTGESNQLADSDEELMVRLREGDDLALNVIMERWETRVIRFITRYTNHRTDALELAQETFVRLYENRRRYRTNAKFSSWIYTIAANLCKNHARWKVRHPAAATMSEEGVDLVNALPAPGDAPDAESAAADEAYLVREAVQELPHDLRTAVLLVEFEGLTQAEAAAVLKCSIKAVETRLYRARKMLKSRLERFF